MYYEERIISCELYYRNSPKGKWIMFDIEKLNERIQDLESRLLSEFNSKKDVLSSFAECDCMGEVSKTLREYGIGT